MPRLTSSWKTISSPSTDAFRAGNSSRALIVASATKARWVNLTPRRLIVSRASARRFATAAKSTSTIVVQWAEVAILRTMCSAIERRIGLIGSRLDPLAGSDASADVGSAVGSVCPFD